MPDIKCSDCGRTFPDGVGLVDGRCPICDADYKAQQEEAEQEDKSPDSDAEEGE